MTQLEQLLAILPKPYIVMGIGVPGSGKSTILEAIARNLEIVRICPDNIREEITGSAADQSMNDQVWAEAYKQAKDILHKGQSAIIDATHTESWRRLQDIQKYREFGAVTIIAVVFDMPLEIIKQRNAARSRVVPEIVLERMYTALQKEPVSHKEGFDIIYIIHS